MKELSSATLWAAICIFSVVGASGIIFGPWEFTALFPLDFTSLGDIPKATLFNQLRFFKALELAVGLLLFSIRGELQTRRLTANIAVGVFWMTPGARLVSYFLDGVPVAPFQALLGFELVGALLFTIGVLSSRRSTKETQVARSRGRVSEAAQGEGGFRRWIGMT